MKGIRDNGKYSKVEGAKFQIDEKKVTREARCDGKWVLTTNTNLLSRQVALQYNQLWIVEQIFRTMKTILATRPILVPRLFSCLASDL